MVPACQVTLKNLQLDYLDLYLIHWPYTFPKGKTLYTVAEEDKFGYSAETEAKCWEVILISIGRMPFNFCVSCVDLLMFERSDCFSMISCPSGPGGSCWQGTDEANWDLQLFHHQDRKTSGDSEDSTSCQPGGISHLPTAVEAQGVLLQQGSVCCIQFAVQCVTTFSLQINNLYTIMDFCFFRDCI